MLPYLNTIDTFQKGIYTFVYHINENVRLYVKVMLKDWPHITSHLLGEHVTSNVLVVYISK